MSNDLAQAGVPADLQKYAGDHRDDFGELDQSDFGIPIIKICQGSSREAKPSPDGVPALPIGTMFLNRNRQIIPVGSHFVPLLRRVRYIKWRSKKPSDGMEFSTENKEDPRIVNIDGLKFGPNGEPPLVTKFVNFYVYLQGYEEGPCLLSFFRSSAKLGKEFTQNLITATRGSKLPLYLFKFKLLTPKLVENEDGSWGQFKFEAAGTVAEARIPFAERMAGMAHALANAASGGEAALDEPEETTAQPKVLKTVEGATITSNIPVVPAAPIISAPVASPPPAQNYAPAVPQIPAPATTVPDDMKFW